MRLHRVLGKLLPFVAGFFAFLWITTGEWQAWGENKKVEASAALAQTDTSQTAEAAEERIAKPKKARRSLDKTKSAKGKNKPQRFGSVIELRPEKKDYYLELHANTWPSVLKQIRKSNIRNYSIYLAELEGKLYLFSYFEYVGDDFDADMAVMAEDPETQRWWKETDPCQKRLPETPDGQQWLKIPEVFHTD